MIALRTHVLMAERATMISSPTCATAQLVTADGSANQVNITRDYKTVYESTHRQTIDSLSPAIGPYIIRDVCARGACLCMFACVREYVGVGLCL